MWNLNLSYYYFLIQLYTVRFINCILLPEDDQTCCENTVCIIHRLCLTITVYFITCCVTSNLKYGNFKSLSKVSQRTFYCHSVIRCNERLLLLKKKAGVLVANMPINITLLLLSSGRPTHSFIREDSYLNPVPYVCYHDWIFFLKKIFTLGKLWNWNLIRTRQKFYNCIPYHPLPITFLFDAVWWQTCLYNSSTGRNING